jgi:hypothetical protein
MGMGLTMTAARQRNVGELFTLVAELNEYAKCSVIPMRGHGNVTGADQVLTWTSGYPFAVSYARGYPQFSPGEFTAVDVLARREADAALILASDPGRALPPGGGRAPGAHPHDRARPRPQRVRGATLACSSRRRRTAWTPPVRRTGWTTCPSPSARSSPPGA